MISIQLQSGDLENIRFAFSPLLEVSMSYHILPRPDRHSLILPWVEEADRALNGLEFPYMNAVLEGHYLADFATPTPTTTQATFEEELASMWNTPDDVIRRNVETVISYNEETELRRHFLVDPHDALGCLRAELRLYWQLTLKHHWPQMVSVLEGDILYQARQLALNGVDTMFSSLSPRLQYANREIKLDKWHFHRLSPSSYELDGSGLQLVPSIFEGDHISWQIAPEWRPMVIYGARGIGLWHRRNLPEPEKALQLALGAGRAKVLQALQTPTPTGELARQLKVTSGAISQQLHRLQKAGLVESHRNSNKVYYQLTARGENLLTLFIAS